MTAVAGVDLVVLGAFVLLGLGVAGSALPGLPGAAFSLAGVLTYWWHTGYADPGPIVLAGLVIAAIGAAVLDWLGGAIATLAGGGSTRSTAAAGVVGAVLFFLAGPVGVLLGIAGTVFAFEYAAGGSAAGSVRTAAYATVGVLASAVVQFVVTVSILVAMVLVAVL